MVRFIALVVIVLFALTLAYGGSAGFFGGVAVLAACVTGFGLLVTLCTELLRET